MLPSSSEQHDRLHTVKTGVPCTWALEPAAFGGVPSGQEHTEGHSNGKRFQEQAEATPTESIKMYTSRTPPGWTNFPSSCLASQVGSRCTLRSGLRSWLSAGPKGSGGTSGPGSGALVLS